MDASTRLQFRRQHALFVLYDLHGDRQAALAGANWIAQGLGLPVRILLT
jgi:hypothetical protein